MATNLINNSLRERFLRKSFNALFNTHTQGFHEAYIEKACSGDLR